MPCYDFVLVADPTFDPGWDVSGIADSPDVTGGEYKTRERIHPSLADLGLLVIPAS